MDNPPWISRSFLNRKRMKLHRVRYVYQRGMFSDDKQTGHNNTNTSVLNKTLCGKPQRQHIKLNIIDGPVKTGMGQNPNNQAECMNVDGCPICAKVCQSGVLAHTSLDPPSTIRIMWQHIVNVGLLHNEITGTWRLWICDISLSWGWHFAATEAQKGEIPVARPQGEFVQLPEFYDISCTNCKNNKEFFQLKNMFSSGFL